MARYLRTTADNEVKDGSQVKDIARLTALWATGAKMVGVRTREEDYPPPGPWGLFADIRML